MLEEWAAWLKASLLESMKKVAHPISDWGTLTLKASMLACKLYGSNRGGAETIVSSEMNSEEYLKHNSGLHS